MGFNTTYAIHSPCSTPGSDIPLGAVVPISLACLGVEKNLSMVDIPPPKRKGESNLYIGLDLPQNPKSQFNSGLIGWIYASTKKICFLEIYLLIDSILKNTTPTSRELLL